MAGATNDCYATNKDQAVGWKTGSRNATREPSGRGLVNGRRHDLPERAARPRRPEPLPQAAMEA